MAKQTIYRWWSSKVDLLLDCLIDDAGNDLPPFDTGSSADREGAKPGSRS